MAKRIIIIGGGPGGYVSAIKAAQLGAQVSLVERDALGGTCVNRGCIPTKFFLESASLLARIREAEAFGISVPSVSASFPAMAKRKEAIVRQLTSGLNSLMKKNKIEVVKGTASLVDARTVQVLESGLQLGADNIIIATGSKAARTPIDGVDTPNVINSDGMLAAQYLPKSLVIIGGGAVGLEFAQFLARMGAEVTILEVLPHILAGEDEGLSRQLHKLLATEGVHIVTGAVVLSIGDGAGGQKTVRFSPRDGTAEREITAEQVMLAVGRIPNLDDLGVDVLGLEVEDHHLVVNEFMETNVPGMYAVGDVIGNHMLAHVAMEEGKRAAINALTGNKATMDYSIVPKCVYTSPEFASVGLTETEAKEKHGDVKVGRFRFLANGRALTENETDGMVKVVAEPRYGQILGVHILGPHATELIAECITAMRLEATVEEFSSTIHAHPTLSEAVLEGVLDVLGERIH